MTSSILSSWVEGQILVVSLLVNEAHTDRRTGIYSDE